MGTMTSDTEGEKSAWVRIHLVTYLWKNNLASPQVLHLWVQWCEICTSIKQLLPRGTVVWVLLVLPRRVQCIAQRVSAIDKTRCNTINRDSCRILQWSCSRVIKWPEKVFGLPPCCPGETSWRRGEILFIEPV